MATPSEAYSYPAQARLLHWCLGTFGSIRCRAINFDVRERSWALDAALDHLLAGTDLFCAEIAQPRPVSRSDGAPGHLLQSFG